MIIYVYLYRYTDLMFYTIYYMSNHIFYMAPQIFICMYVYIRLYIYIYTYVRTYGRDLCLPANLAVQQLCKNHPLISGYLPHLEWMYSACRACPQARGKLATQLVPWIPNEPLQPSTDQRDQQVSPSLKRRKYCFSGPKAA